MAVRTRDNEKFGVSKGLTALDTRIRAGEKAQHPADRAALRFEGDTATVLVRLVLDWNSPFVSCMFQQSAEIQLAISTCGIMRCRYAMVLESREYGPDGHGGMP